MRALVLFATAFALATGAFWATMLTEPPRSEARGRIVPAIHVPLVPTNIQDPHRYDADDGDVF
ncbi:hypothetical protein U8607_11340 [Methylobacterium durans]|jgi:hypothetical protein|uniref:Uncharacterized protein n=1 Tax=Methylobacterium durans TaxID=2202825 RepID=A0A2U8WDS8_9HYPH|nr:hypothetical protein [Methylobacterium durans]AWN43668.1 hypothetical protein DK389_28100 [Methylobacterium durans]MEA1832675.1 hypothetical protein [Methylobacterium durans]